MSGILFFIFASCHPLRQSSYRKRKQLLVPVIGPPAKNPMPLKKLNPRAPLYNSGYSVVIFLVISTQAKGGDPRKNPTTNENNIIAQYSSMNG